MAVTVDIDVQMMHALKDRMESLQLENDNLHGDIEHLKEQKDLSDTDNITLRNKLTGAQQEIQTHSSSQERLETLVCTLEKDLEQTRTELRQLSKEKKEAEARLEKELEEYESDRLRWHQREAELVHQVQARQIRRESFIAAAKKTKEAAPPKPAIPLKHAKIPATKKNESTDQVRLVKSQGKSADALSEQIARQKLVMDKQTVKMEDQEQNVRRLEKEIAHVQKLNRSLMEENESYQILLHEKTMSGNFTVDAIAVPSAAKRSQPELGGKCAPTPQPNSKQKRATHSLNLQAELKLASQNEKRAPNTSEKPIEKTMELLEDEIKTLQDANRALQLYMNKILMRIVDNKQLEDVLSIDQPTPGIKPQVSASTMLPKTSASAKDTPAPTPSRTFSSTILGRARPDDSRRRTVSYWTTAGQNAPRNDDRRSSTAASGTWAKAFRRMSGIGNVRPTASQVLEPEAPL